MIVYIDSKQDDYLSVGKRDDFILMGYKMIFTVDGKENGFISMGNQVILYGWETRLFSLCRWESRWFNID